MDGPPSSEYPISRPHSDAALAGDAQDDEAARHLNNVRSSQLFEAAVELPLSAVQHAMVLQLDFFKKWYLLCHAGYMMALVLLGTAVLFLAEPSVSLLDAFFVAMSTVCNCGLQTVNVGKWEPLSILFRHALIVPAGVVVTSAFQPLLRLALLRRVRSVFAPNDSDDPAQRSCRRHKEDTARRLYYTSVIAAVTPLAYFAFVNGALGLVLYLGNASGLSLLDTVYMQISAFHSCVFLSMEQYAGDGAVVGVVTLACALGFTAFPVVLRGFVALEWWIYQGVYKFVVAWRHANSGDDVSDPLLERMDEEEVIDLERIVGDGESQLALDPWSQGFADILASKHPGCFHPFLFLPAESAYLGAAWWALTLMQAVPFWAQHWHGILATFPPRYRVYLAVCQAGVVRFAAASFVPLCEYTNAHIAVTILAMFLPALPISTDRAYRKWRQMMTTSVVRLLTSRLFWLFTAMISVLFAEECSLSRALSDTRFDIMTRTFFEVISAYAGCGLSLSLPGSPVSFTGSTAGFSKLVICAVLFGGRHRFVDLGIDLGFSALQTNSQDIAARVPL